MNKNSKRGTTLEEFKEWVIQSSIVYYKEALLAGDANSIEQEAYATLEVLQSIKNFEANIVNK